MLDQRGMITILAAFVFSAGGAAVGISQFEKEQLSQTDCLSDQIVTAESHDRLGKIDEIRSRQAIVREAIALCIR